MSLSRFGHMVYFTLKDSSDEAIDALIAGCDEFLTDHPGTVLYSSGKLADTTRPVNDRGFHVALHIVFDSREAHDAYQVAPRHDAFIAKFKDNWERVRVFDSDVS
ncbi:MAG: Dabb family protein [Planctomycetales bacterium]|nr:Dabb family protein [Planctomycetales bacterium]